MATTAIKMVLIIVAMFVMGLVHNAIIGRSILGGGASK